jgi:pimeloyl-ACP methyl ester carboxylesterase
MVRSAQLYLENRNFRIHDRILLYGFSLAGDFVNRFTMLHPDRVLAVAGGGIAWPIVPTGEFEKEKLRYPIGLADIEAFTGKPASLDSLRSVAWFFFRGSEDRKDSVDYRDCYAEADAELIRRRFGPTPAARWPAAERLYAEERLSAWLVIYPRVGHRLTPEIQEDIVHFFEQRLRAVRGTPVPPGSVDW